MIPSLPQRSSESFITQCPQDGGQILSTPGNHSKLLLLRLCEPTWFSRSPKQTPIAGKLETLMATRSRTKYHSVDSTKVTEKDLRNIPQIIRNNQKKLERSCPTMMTAPFMAEAKNGVSAIRTSTARTFVLAVQIILPTLILPNDRNALPSTMACLHKSRSIQMSNVQLLMKATAILEANTAAIPVPLVSSILRTIIKAIIPDKAITTIKVSIIQLNVLTTKKNKQSITYQRDRFSFRL